MIRVSLKQANIALFLALVVTVAVLFWGTLNTYREIPPLPQSVRTPGGQILFERPDIRLGQSVFQKYNLMGYGTLLGNGSYFGPDYTAEYLRFIKRDIGDQLAQRLFDRPLTDLSANRRGQVMSRVRSLVERSSFENGVAIVPDEWARAHWNFVEFYRSRFVGGSPEMGLAKRTVAPDEIDEFCAFVAWTGWFSLLPRPNAEYTYTNNWPPDPELGLTPTTKTFTWTAWTIAIVLLIVMVAVVANHFIELEPVKALPPLEEVRTGPLSFLQKLTVALLFACAGIFLLQTLAGGYLANAYVGREEFYGVFEMLGFERMQVLPFQSVRSAHTAMAILWVVGIWMSSTLYGSQLLGGDERSWHKPLAWFSVILVTISILGTLVGVYGSIQGWIQEYWYWLGTEGTEYLEMGRLWRWGIGVGFVIWFVILYSVLRRADVKWRPFLNMLLIIGGAITLFFFASFLYGKQTNWVLIDYWRWYVVHAWVEGVFAFFQLLVTGWFLAGLGLIDREEVTRSMYLEGFIIIFAGLLSVGHHFWWIGEPSLWISLGSIFGTLEVLPLFMLLLSALRTMREAHTRLETRHRIPFYFFLASAIWQFVGSGILGLLINPPIINYYEHGTFLTVAHAHASFYGAFGFLALGMLLYTLRHAVPEGWSETRLIWAFWLSNAGLIIMLALSVIPIGVAQLIEIVRNSYATGRAVSFYQRPLILLFNELRLPGDTMIIISALLIVYELAPKAYRAVFAGEFP